MKFRSFVAALTTLLLFAFTPCMSACKSSDKQNPATGNQEQNDGILTIDKAAMVLEKGDVAVLNCYVVGGETVLFTSSDESIATVSENGEIRALSVGEAFIEAKAGNEKKYCKVTVTDVVYAVTLDCEETFTMTLGAVRAIRASVTKNGMAVAETVTFTIEGDAGKLTVKENVATLTATKTGVLTLKATAQNSEASCVVRVKTAEDFNA